VRAARVSTPALSAARPRLLRLPGKRSVVWLALAPVAAVALAGLVMHLAGISGGDDPAHFYKIALLRHGQSVLWDNFWYGGSYGSITYGVVYYWLAQFIPGFALTVLSGGLLPLFFYLYLRDAWGVPDPVGAWALAAVMVVYLAWGQSPFLLAMCLTMGGLVLLARRRPVLAALPCSLGVLTNPLALIAGGVFVLAALVARPEARRPTLVFALAMLPVCALRVALAAVFAAPSWEYHYTSELLGLATVAALGVLLARRNPEPQRRALQWVFVALLVIVVPAYLVPSTPIGSNAARFFYVFGAPLLLIVARPSRLGRAAPAAIVAAVFVFQLAFPVWMLAHAESFTATRAAFFAPALRFAARVYDPDYRFHVVTPEMHWESYYFPAAGFAITRGWYRQDDALHDAQLYNSSLSAAAYCDWLRRMGVRYVFLPHAPLVTTSRREAAILKGSNAFSVVFRDAQWTVYRLTRTAPLVVPQQPGAADMLTMDHTSATFSVSRPGQYLVKLTWSPYWTVARQPTDFAQRGRDAHVAGQLQLDGVPLSAATLRRGPDSFMLFQAPGPGLYLLRFDLASAAAAELKE